MKIKSLTKWTLNETLTLPIVGEVTFDNDNVIDVANDKVDELLKQECGIKWEIVDKGKKSQAIDIIIDQPIVDDNTKLESLQALTTKELKELLVSFPDKETKDLKSKSQMVEYLVNKI